MQMAPLILDESRMYIYRCKGFLAGKMKNGGERTDPVKYQWMILGERLCIYCISCSSSQLAVNLTQLHIFGCKCFIHDNSKDKLGKFDPKSDEGIFLGYSNRSKTYKVLNK